MRATIIVCEEATRSPAGGVNIIGGGITQMWSNKPGALPAFKGYVVVFVTTEPQEHGERRSVLVVRDPDGTALIMSRSKFKADPSKPVHFPIWRVKIRPRSLGPIEITFSVAGKELDKHTILAARSPSAES